MSSVPNTHIHQEAHIISACNSNSRGSYTLFGNTHGIHSHRCPNIHTYKKIFKKNLKIKNLRNKKTELGDSSAVKGLGLCNFQNYKVTHIYLSRITHLMSSIVASQNGIRHYYRVKRGNTVEPTIPLLDIFQWECRPRTLNSTYTNIPSRLTTKTKTAKKRNVCPKWDGERVWCHIPEGQ